MLSFYFLQLASLGILEQTVLFPVGHTVRYVDTQMVGVPVGLVGGVMTVQYVIMMLDFS